MNTETHNNLTERALKPEVLAKELDIDFDDAQTLIDNSDYLVLTDDEADEKAAEYIEDLLWAFNPSFLAYETGIDQEVFEAIQSNGKCEGNNDAIGSCISDIEEFIESAIRADGRGHFISSYDGEEIETDDDYYIYRIN